MKTIGREKAGFKSLSLILALIFSVQQPLLSGFFLPMAYAEVAPVTSELSPTPVVSATEPALTTSTSTETCPSTEFFLGDPLGPATETSTASNIHCHHSGAEHEEHEALFDLVRYEDVTHKVKADCVSCRWSDASTWEGGVAPGEHARVLITQGTKVIVDSIRLERLHTIRVDGILEFDHDKDTGLKVETIVVSTTGTLLMGTEAQPVIDGVEAKIIIADRGAFDTVRDPRQLGRGLISHGTVQMVGVAKTAHASVTGPVVRGSTELVLSTVPLNWKVGDRLVLTNTIPEQPHQRDEIAIQAISGNRVQLDKALAWDYKVPDGFSLYVANVSRNVVIESEAPALGIYDLSRRGHVMFMHSDQVKILNAGFYGLGRTDKRVAVDDSLLDAEGKLVPGTGDNQRGRYAVHFHRTGVDPTKPPAIVKGSVVVDSPGWGFVNHGSYVNFEENVAFNVNGAAFVTERGDEMGAFRRNIVISSWGSWEGVESRSPLLQDFGHGGHGFWFQGPNIEVENNIVAGTSRAAYAFFTRGIDDRNGVVKILASQLKDPTWAGGQDSVEVGSVPIRLFKGNVAFASPGAFEMWYHLLRPGHTARSVIEDFTGWNLGRGGMFFGYINQTIFRNVRLDGWREEWTAPGEPRLGSAGVNSNGQAGNLLFENMHLEGWGTGIQVPVTGQTVIRGGYFNNLRGIGIATSHAHGRFVSIEGDIRFGTLPEVTLRHYEPRYGRQYDVYLESNFNAFRNDITRLFNPDVIRYGTIQYQNKQLYYYAQAADYIPFKVGEAPAYVPPELLGKTNRQLWNQYGIAIGGIVAPDNAITDPRINGLIGDPANYLPELYLMSRMYTNQLFGYQVIYSTSSWDRRQAKILDTVDLREGWNLITRVIDGYVRTFLIFGDIIPPTFMVSPTTPLVINPLDLKMGFFLAGQIYDNSYGVAFSRLFTNLDREPIQTKEDGTQYILLTFQIKDAAENTTTVNLELVVDANAPLQKHKTTPEEVRPKEPSITLLALLGFKPLRLLSPLLTPLTAGSLLVTP